MGLFLVPVRYYPSDRRMTAEALNQSSIEGWLGFPGIVTDRWAYRMVPTYFSLNLLVCGSRYW